MKFSFSEEQEEFRSFLRRFLEEKSPTTEVRRLMATDAGWEKEQWRKVNTELGLTAIAIPEEYGGQGFGLSEQCIVLEEMGRSLLCAPYFSSAVLTANAILYGASEEYKKKYLPEIASGDLTASLAFTEETGAWDISSLSMCAEKTENTYRLTGVKSFVLDGHMSDLIIVLAKVNDNSGSQRLALFSVDSTATGLTKNLLNSTDQTRKLAKLMFTDVEATCISSEDDVTEAMQKTFLKSCIGLSNEMVGGAERLREDTLEYVKMRMQFGRSIASFQVTKHKATDMLADVELAKSAAYYAAAAFDDGESDIAATASIAKASASEAYMQTAINAVQMHGGIGFTWDNDTHLWFKRAKSSEVFLGTADFHRELMMQSWDQ